MSVLPAPLPAAEADALFDRLSRFIDDQADGDRLPALTRLAYVLAARIPAADWDALFDLAAGARAPDADAAGSMITGGPTDPLEAPPT